MGKCLNSLGPCSHIRALFPPGTSVAESMTKFMNRHFDRSVFRFWLALLCTQLILELNHTAWWKHAYMVFLEPSFQIICKVLSRACQSRRQQYKLNSKAMYSVSTAKRKTILSHTWWILPHTDTHIFHPRGSFPVTLILHCSLPSNGLYFFTGLAQ